MIIHHEQFFSLLIKRKSMLNRQVSYSPTALGRALVLLESEANAGNFSQEDK